MAIDKFSGEYEFLSNFYKINVKVGGLIFPTNEHAFQGLKSDKIDVVRQFVDPTMTAGQAKRLGQKIQLRKDWDKVKVGLMYAINLDKFAGNENMKRLLLDTGKVELIEGNTWGDRVWGVCGGEGENLLGKILMLVRSEIRHLEDLKARKKVEKESKPKEEPISILGSTSAAKEFMTALVDTAEES